MVADAPIVESDVVVSQPVPRNVILYGTSHVMLDIREFLARPRLVSTTVISTGVLPGTVGTQSIISLVNSDTMFDDKMKGFLGRRYTFVYRIIINASRFQSGSYFVSYEPSWTDKTHLYSFNSNECVPTMKHVIVDVGTETEGVLRCPYQAPTNYYDKTSGLGGPGAIHSGVYQRLRVGASAPTTYTVSAYMSLEDVELAIPVYPQSGRIVPYKDREQKVATSKGPIEEALAASEQVSMALCRIPVLSSYLVPVQWSLNIAKRVAGSLGWSRPIQTEALTRVRPVFSDYMPNCDAAEVAMPLAATNANSIELYPGAAENDCDEMSFSYLKTKWSYLSTSLWSTSDVSTTTLYSIDLAPIRFQILSNTVSQHTLFRPSVIAWMSDFFYLYRGSFKLRFRFAKTVMHSGRVVISYNPGHTSAYPGTTFAPTLVNTAYNHAHIIDIRDTNVVELEFPYANCAPYLHRNTPYGIVTVRVLNPLLAPETVSSIIDFTVEVAGCDDLEFAFRVAPSYQFVIPELPGLIQNPEPQGLTPGFAFNGIGEGKSETVGSSSIDAMDTLNARLCIGEQILSMKQLAMISTRSMAFNGFGAQVPGLCHFAYVDTLIPTAPPHLCMLDNVMAPYNLCRGSLLLRHLSTDVDATLVGALEVHLCANSTANATAGAVFTQMDQMLVVSKEDRRALISVRVPFYSQTTSYLNAPVTTVFGASSYLTPRTLATFGLKTGATYNGELYRAAADDLQLSGFIAMPNTRALLT
jgi:hypothetical protein